MFINLLYTPHCQAGAIRSFFLCGMLLGNMVGFADGVSEKDNRCLFRLRNPRKESAMTEQKCTGDHKGHICLLASQQKFDEIKQLTTNPRYICFNCGRVADCENNLCNPMPLKDN